MMFDAPLPSIGIEGLTMHLNLFFKKLIGVIKAHHGDIIQFGGDAILVVWHSPMLKLHDLTIAACFCGIDIQSTLAGYQTSSGTKLSLYVAIAAGTMENIHVGNPGNWIIVFGGEPVSQLSHIMGFCSPGEVVLSVETYNALTVRTERIWDHDEDDNRPLFNFFFASTRNLHRIETFPGKEVL